MELQVQSKDMEDYLKEIPPYINFSNKIIQEKIKGIQEKAHTQKEQAALAFAIARDEIRHSFDTQYQRITIGADETLIQKEGICFAKSHLLATLLRGLHIPAGFCYQRVLRKGTVDSGYALHGLNAIYLEDYGWFRVDPRGNKPGIDAQFSIEEEKLAYPIRTELGEVDYPFVYPAPLDSVIKSMEDSQTTQELFFNRPESI